MKIELDLKIQEPFILLNILKNAARKVHNPNVQNIIGNLINEIESDSKIAHYILALIKGKFFKNNLTRRKIHPDSNME